MEVSITSLSEMLKLAKKYYTPLQEELLARHLKFNCRRVFHINIILRILTIFPQAITEHDFIH
jgi:hypothetical protein